MPLPPPGVVDQQGPERGDTEGHPNAGEDEGQEQHGRGPRPSEEAEPLSEPIQLLQTTRIGICKHRSGKEVASLAKVLVKSWRRRLDSPGFSKGEKGEERQKAKKKEKGLDCSNGKPEAGLSPPREKRGEEPQRRERFCRLLSLRLPPLLKGHRWKDQTATNGKWRTPPQKKKQHPAAPGAPPLPPLSASWRPAISPGTLSQTAVWRCSQSLEGGLQRL